MVCRGTGSEVRQLAEEGFRLPGSSYEELANIIVAYGTRDEAAMGGDVTKLDPAHQASASRNNTFLAAIGILEGEGRRLVTHKGRALAHALASGKPGEARKHWRGIVSTDEFLQNAVSAVKLRGGMTPSDLIAYIANAARLPRNRPTLNGAAAIVEILKQSGLLVETAGTLTADMREPQEDPTPGTDDSPAEVRISAESPAGNGTSAAPGIGITVQIQVRCTPDELEDLAPRLKALLRELSEPTP